MELFDISLYFIPWLFESTLFNEYELYSILTALFLVSKKFNTFITDMNYTTCNSKLLKSLFCPSYSKVIDLNSIPNRKKCPENCVIVNHNMDKREYYYNISNCKLIVLINCTINQEFVKYKEYDIYFINCKFTYFRIDRIHLTNVGNVYFYNCKNLPIIICDNMLNLELINCHSNSCIICGNVNYINIEECIFTISPIYDDSYYKTYYTILQITQLITKLKNPDFRLKIRLSKNIITFMNLNIKHDLYIVKNSYSNMYDILDLDYKNNNIFIKYSLDISNPNKIQIIHSKPMLYTRVKKEKKGKTDNIEKIDVELIKDFVEQHYISEINSNLQFPIPNELNISSKFLCFSQLTILHVKFCDYKNYFTSVFDFMNNCKKYLNLQVEIKTNQNSNLGFYFNYTYTIANTISFTIAKNDCLINLKIPNYNSLWDIIIRIIKNYIDSNNDYFDYNSFDISQQKLKELNS